MGGIQWVHANSVGVDAIVTPELATTSTVVTNTRGVFEPPMAEYVLAMLLYFAKDLGGTVDAQRAARWDKRPTESLRSRRVLLVGPGAVGREIASLLRGAGITVDVVGRTSRTDEVLGEVRGIGELNALLPQADDLVVALPLTADTRGIIDADVLGRLRPGARVINVGRGPLIDEDAFIAELRAGRLGGAALDVFDQEPLPADHPFWAMDNVMVSPHMAGDAVGWERRSIELFVTNLERWSAGQPLLNIVDKSAFAAR
ncbi:D-2-hydroxyacid dehydrogenase [Saccharopolyspora karakumensis]|uniref:D-2-hydroxyacid dehydrogenase n=2 Tax=Saccharopolyspora karakumensis TaxID=2530386 RepID=A0A4R5BF27_9PSEU|nr:D-2-hydroxyacid dehydrogenase [Saccharopolyspora karakumensis]